VFLDDPSDGSRRTWQHQDPIGGNTRGAVRMAGALGPPGDARSSCPTARQGDLRQVYPFGFLGCGADRCHRTPASVIGRSLQPWLDYLIRLGCNGLALNPIFAPETHGYDVVDYLRIDPRLGDDGDVEWLVDACHRRAIRVLFDGVFTHVGRSFPASGRVYAVLASKETVTGPLTIQYRTATGGVGEAQVAWVVEPLRGTRRIRVTREEIRLRLTASPLTVVVSADHIEVESAPQRFPTGQRLAEPGEPGRLRPEPGRPGGPHQPRPSTGSSTRSRNSCGFRRAPPRGLDGACLACHQNDDLECVAGAFTGFGYVGIAGQVDIKSGILHRMHDSGRWLWSRAQGITVPDIERCESLVGPGHVTAPRVSPATCI